MLTITLEYYAYYVQKVSVTSKVPAVLFSEEKT